MNRAQLGHVLRAVSAHTGVTELIVIGSQAVLGTADVEQLPPDATRSIEVDVAVDPVRLAVDATEVADEIDGVFGEYSAFHSTFGYYAQGVEVTTAVLPGGWRDRLRPLPVEAPEGPVAVGWCLEIHDLWVSKAAAGRPKDAEFCLALARAGWVDAPTCQERARSLDEPWRSRVERAVARSS